MVPRPGISEEWHSLPLLNPGLKVENLGCWAELHHRGCVFSEVSHVVIKIVQSALAVCSRYALYIGRAIAFSSAGESLRPRASRSTELGAPLSAADCVVGLTWRRNDLRSECVGTPEIFCIPATNVGTTRIPYASAMWWCRFTSTSNTVSGMPSSPDSSSSIILRTSHHAQWSEVNRRIIEAGLGSFLVVLVNQFKVGAVLF